MKNAILAPLKSFMLLSICFANLSSAQNDLNKLGEKGKPSSCEYLFYQIDKALYSNSGNEKQSVIFIFRLGRSEFSKHLNKTRIELIRKYVQRKGYLSRAVFAIGPKNNYLGTMEIYLQGELFAELFFIKHNRPRICIE